MDKLIVDDLKLVPPGARDCVLTIGNFDGVHLGHQRILLDCSMMARRQRKATVVLTFDPLPEAVLHPKQTVPPLIYSPRKNAELLLELGADVVVIAKTTPELLSLPPREFFNMLILRYLKPVQIIEGANFFFGRGRTGTVETLQQFGGENGFGVSVIDPVVVNIAQVQRRVSSTLIRDLIQGGQIEDANYCLGREFSIDGTIVSGDGRGRALEFPTANLAAAGQLIPADGIYAGRAELEGKSYIAAISIGNKPTFGPTERTVEAFLLNAEGDFYSRQMTLSFVRRIRTQQKFENAQALREQIAHDVDQVRKLLQK